jgi:hypothetical protein
VVREIVYAPLVVRKNKKVGNPSGVKTTKVLPVACCLEPEIFPQLNFMPQAKVVKNKSYQAGLVEYLGSRLSSMLQAKIVRKQILSTFLPAA